MKFGMLPCPVDLYKLMVNFVLVSNIQGTELNFGDF